MHTSIVLLFCAAFAWGRRDLHPRAIPVGDGPASCSTPARNTCTFYSSCLEAVNNCGPSGYPIAYGLHYCEAFSAASFSARGNLWVSDTMQCLQDYLVPYATYANSIGCDKLKDEAFASHPDCYVDSGVCTLPPADWARIVGTVSPKDMFGSANALKAVLQTAEGCKEFYKWLIEQGIITLLDEAGHAIEWGAEKIEDAGEAIWDKATGWL